MEGVWRVRGCGGCVEGEGCEGAWRMTGCEGAGCEGDEVWWMRGVVCHGVWRVKVHGG